MKELTVAIQDEYEGKVVYKTELYTEEEYKKLEQERDYFKEQAILWRNDYKNEYEENRKLKEERDNCLKEVKLCYNDIHSLEGQISDLEEENKKLNERISTITMVSDDEKQSIEHILELEEENRKLNEKIRFLEQCLDNKERVNKSLREENNKLKEELQEWLNAIRQKI